MKLYPAALIRNFLTLGYTGAKATQRTVKKMKEEKNLPVISEVAGFLWLVPAFGWFFFAMELLDIWMISTIDAAFSFSEIYDVVELFPACFIYFSVIHFPLGLAVLQHLKEQKKGKRAMVLWFIGYGLDWNADKHLNGSKSEPDGTGQPMNPPENSKNQLDD